MTAPLFCFVDFISPYAYLASTQIEALAARHDRTVQFVPVLFAALLGNSGGIGPAEIPLKRAYLYKDVLRIATLYGVRIAPPPTHPFNPLLALRVASAPMPAAERARVVHALFAATWGGTNPDGSSPGVETADAITRALAAVQIDAAPHLAAAATTPVKEDLRIATDAAIAAGAFGVPTVEDTGELFWGCDSLPHLERYLAGERAGTAADLARFQALKPSATRR